MTRIQYSNRYKNNRYKKCFANFFLLIYSVIEKRNSYYNYI